MILRTLPLAIFLVLLSTGCQTQQVNCSVQSDCGSSAVCLQTKVCAPKCTSDASCSADERCSSAGGCVARADCGADSDCKEGLICGQRTQRCQVPCQTLGCPNGETCQPSGHCVGNLTEAVGGTGGPGGGTDGGPTDCGGEKFPATFARSNILVVLDRSGSMSWDVLGNPNSTPTRWDIATSVVKEATSSYDSKIRFGLSLFPTSMTTCGASAPIVSINDANAAAISANLPSAPGKVASSNPANANYHPDAASTPIAAALNEAGKVNDLVDPTYTNHVLLLTDGSEQCGGKPVEEVKKLFGKNIKTWVVGFGSAKEVDPQTLSVMAQEGGTARQGAVAYYLADDRQELMNALKKIASGAANCSFNLQKAPPDPTKIFVYVNGQLIARDPQRVNGWDYSNNNLRINLFGSACDALTNGTNGTVKLVYGCPDPDGVTEGGGDGGTGGSGGTGGTGGSGGTGGTGEVTLL